MQSRKKIDGLTFNKMMRSLITNMDCRSKRLTIGQTQQRKMIYIKNQVPDQGNLSTGGKGWYSLCVFSVNPVHKEELNLMLKYHRLLFKVQWV